MGTVNAPGPGHSPFQGRICVSFHYHLAIFQDVGEIPRERLFFRHIGHQTSGDETGYSWNSSPPIDKYLNELDPHQHKTNMAASKPRSVFVVCI